MNFQRLFLTLVSFAIISGAVLSLKTQSTNECKNYNLFFDLKKSLLEGTWYPVIASKKTPKKVDCYSLTITKVDETQLQVGAKDTRMRTRPFLASLFESKSKNSFTVTSKFMKGVVTILDTDYNSYAVVLGCADFLLIGKNYYAAILSRKPSLSNTKIVELQKMIENKTGIKNFKEVKQGEQCRVSE